MPWGALILVTRELTRWRLVWKEGRSEMPGRTGHGREPEPLDDILDCLAYVYAVHGGDQGGAAAAFDVVHLRLAGRSDAMVAPLKLACLIAEEAQDQGCDVAAILAGVRDRILA
jgi:hypothetical protein